jgi:hypothetical protein
LVLSFLLNISTSSLEYHAEPETEESLPTQIDASLHLRVSHAFEYPSIILAKENTWTKLSTPIPSSELRYITLNVTDADRADKMAAMSLERNSNGQPRFPGCGSIRDFEFLGKLGEGTFG